MTFTQEDADLIRDASIRDQWDVTELDGNETAKLHAIADSIESALASTPALPALTPEQADEVLDMARRVGLDFRSETFAKLRALASTPAPKEAQ